MKTSAPLVNGIFNNIFHSSETHYFNTSFYDTLYSDRTEIRRMKISSQSS